MTKRIHELGIILFMVIILFSFQDGLNSEEGLHSVWAIKDCRIVPLTGSPIEKGVVVLRNGLIEAVGAKVPIPADTEILDGSNLTVYPGLIDALGQSLLKLPEEKFDSSKFYSGEFTDKDRGITPELRAFDHINLGKSILPIGGRTFTRNGKPDPLRNKRFLVNCNRKKPALH